MSKTALITGITGQDGAYLAKLLLSKGYTVFGVTRDRLDVDDKNLRYLGIDEDVQLIELPQLDKDRIFKILRKTQPDEIYNLSSQSSVGHSFTDPYSTLQYNIMSVLYWLEGIKNINKDINYYQASSSEMFGNVPVSDLPLRESLVFHPASPYGISKATAHWLAVNYRESSNIFSACGILFNHESALRGGRFVVKKIINTAVKIKMGLYTEKLTLGNLNIQRDWGYAPEYVKAMWLILQQNHPGDFLICSGNVMPLSSLVESVFHKLGLDQRQYIVQDPSLLRPNDLEIIYGDNTKAKSLLGWEYKMTNEELIQQLIDDEYDYVRWELNSDAC
jgi:GDPmannose 4,6-dehydratase